MKNKKAFTLVEMLGIIAILAVVLLVTFPILNNSLKAMKENENKNLMTNLKISAEAYIESNINNYPELDKSGSVTITIKDLYDANMLKGNIGVNLSNEIVVTKKQDNTLDFYYIDVNEKKTYDFNYTGNVQEFTADKNGLYKLEIWGAQGGSNTNSDKAGAGILKGGFGGYSTGLIKLNDTEKLYVFVGQMGLSRQINSAEATVYAYPNGGAIKSTATNYNAYLNGGGGSTHIAKENKLIKEMNPKSNSLIIVAGGGGGIANYWEKGDNGGSGGGFVGGSTTTNFSNINATGGTQTEAGLAGGNSDGHGRSGEWNSGAYGQGGGILTFSGRTGATVSGGGGGGYYGGGASWGGSGAGGSGYIGNPSLKGMVMYCYNCEESDEPITLTVSTTGSSYLKNMATCSDGYSSDPISKCAKAGNGYARITYLGEKMEEAEEICDNKTTFCISKRSDLEKLAEEVNNGDNKSGKTYILTRDIDLGGLFDENGNPLTGNNPWTPIGSQEKPFSGTLDGAGHIITGMYIDSSTRYTGLFSVINGGTIKNLGIENSYIKSSAQNTGGITGDAIAYSQIINCYNGATISARKFLGGISGSLTTSEIRNCYNKGNIMGNGEQFAAGIVGYTGGGLTTTVENCYNSGTINTSSSYGGDGAGIVGGHQGKLFNSYNVGTIYGGTSGGGIIGQLYAPTTPIVNNNYNVGTSSAGIINGVYSTGTYTVTNNYFLNTAATYGIRTKSSNEGASPLTAQEMPSIISVINGDRAYLEDTKGMNNGYPILKWQQK